jgi:hypothetical protein
VLAASVAAKGFYDEFGKQLAQLLTKRLFRGKVEIGIPDESSPDTGRGGETILDAAEARSVDEISRALGISGLRGVERIRIVRTIRIHAAEDFSRHRRNDY